MGSTWAAHVNFNFPHPPVSHRVRKNSYNAVEVSQEASQWFANYLKKDDIRLVRILPEEINVARGKDGEIPVAYRAKHISVSLDSARNLLTFFVCPFLKVAFQDSTSFHIVSEASLEDLNNKITSEDVITERNFRPNFVVEGCPAFAEVIETLRL